MFCACIAVHMDQGMLVYTNRTYDTRMTTTTHLIQMMTPSQGVEMSVTTTHNHPVDALDKLMEH